MVDKVVAADIQDQVTEGAAAARLINDEKRAINELIDRDNTFGDVVTRDVGLNPDDIPVNARFSEVAFSGDSEDLNTRDVIPVDTVADLRLLTGLQDGQVIYLKGHTQIGIGGGELIVKGDHTTEVDNNGTVFVVDGKVIERIEWDGITVKSSWFGDDIQASIDYLAGIYSASQVNAGPVSRGKWILDENKTISSSVRLRPNIDFDFSGGSITAASSFTATQNAIVYSNDSDFYNASFHGLRITAPNLNLYGFNIHGVRSEFDYVRVTGCQRGSIVRGGFGFYGKDYKGVGYLSSTGVTSVENEYGFVNQCSDSKYQDINCVLFSKGINANANNTRWYNCHVWSLPANVKMKVGFDLQNEGNRLYGCVVDTPTPQDTSAAPSLSNGGYGFLNRGNANNNQLFGCEVIVSEQTGNVDNTVISYKLNATAELYGCTERNYASSTNIFRSPAVQFLSNNIKQGSSVIGGDVLSNGTGNILYPGLAPNMTSSPDLLVNGSDSGITYSNGTKYCAYTRRGPFTDFYIKIKLASKGTNSGALTIRDLPFTFENGFGNTLRVAFPVHTRNNFIQGVYAEFTPGSTTCALFKEDGTALLAAEIQGSQEFTITGQLLTSDGFFDDVD